jgi:hypothetical protein
MRAFGPLFIFATLLSLFNAAYILLGHSPSPSATLLLGYAQSLFILLWLMGDARRRRCTPCYDFGFLLAVYLPLSAVWYLLWTRGWKGIVWILGFIGLLYFPWVFAIIVSMLQDRFN